VTSIFDSTVLARPENVAGERFVLSRKNGKIKLKVKSPLFEKYFRDQAKGEVGGIDPLWGVPLYRVEIDPQVDQELAAFGVSFRSLNRTFWRDLSGPLNKVDRYQPDPPGEHRNGLTNNILFNISFLLAEGLGEGLEFSLRQLPLSLIEGPGFIYTTTLRRGLYHVVKQFLMDYEATVVIQSDVKF
jgi:hypothetical protein